MGIKKLRKVQIGPEATAGTAVAATVILRGLNGTLEDQREQKFSEEDIGNLGGSDRLYDLKKLGGITLEGDATFEHLPYFLAMAIENTVAGTADASTGSGFGYTYILPTTSVPTVQTYTLEAGDDQQVEEMPYAFVSEVKLSGASGEEIKVSADLLGGEVTPTTFTPALTLEDVETILFQKATFYIDGESGTIGTTQVSDTLLGINLDIKGGKNQRWTGDGSLSPSHLGQDMPEVTLEVTFEHDGNSTAEKANWRSLVTRLIRVEIEGSALTTAGDWVNKLLRIDLAGKWSKFDKLDEQDGNDIIAGTLTAKPSNTAGLFGEILVVNEVTALS